MKTSQKTSYVKDIERIKIFMSKYHVSEDGHVYRVEGDYRREIGSMHINTGYMQGGMSIKIDGTRHTFYFTTHRLVALVHVKNPKPYEYNFVNHKNGIRTDNRAENLEWCTAAENNEHAIRTGLVDYSKPRDYSKILRGEKCVFTKLTEEQVIEIRYLFDNKIFGVVALSRKFNVNRASISGIVYRRNWKHI